MFQISKTSFQYARQYTISYIEPNEPTEGRESGEFKPRINNQINANINLIY